MNGKIILGLVLLVALAQATDQCVGKLAVADNSCSQFIDEDSCSTHGVTALTTNGVCNWILSDTDYAVDCSSFGKNNCKNQQELGLCTWNNKDEICTSANDDSEEVYGSCENLCGYYVYDPDEGYYFAYGPYSINNYVGGCSCETFCGLYNNCCDDYQEFCVDNWTGCANINDGAEDSLGQHCWYYDGYEFFCGLYDDDDFTANDMCCTCGGGGEISEKPACTYNDECASCNDIQYDGQWTELPDEIMCTWNGVTELCTNLNNQCRYEEVTTETPIDPDMESSMDDSSMDYDMCLDADIGDMTSFLEMGDFKVSEMWSLSGGCGFMEGPLIIGEDLFACSGFQGRIVKWDAEDMALEDWGVSAAPLGMDYDKNTGTIIVADTYMGGIVRYSVDGEFLEVIVDAVANNFCFVNDVAWVDDIIFFTDTCFGGFGEDQYHATYCLRDGELTMIAGGADCKNDICGANGVAASNDGTYIVLSSWLSTPTATMDNSAVDFDPSKAGFLKYVIADGSTEWLWQPSPDNYGGADGLCQGMDGDWFVTFSGKLLRISEMGDIKGSLTFTDIHPTNIDCGEDFFLVTTGDANTGMGEILVMMLDDGEHDDSDMESSMDVYCAPGCSYSSIGDGICDYTCLVWECEFDMGDCDDDDKSSNSDTDMCLEDEIADFTNFMTEGEFTVTDLSSLTGECEFMEGPLIIGDDLYATSRAGTVGRVVKWDAEDMELQFWGEHGAPSGMDYDKTTNTIITGDPNKDGVVRYSMDGEEIELVVSQYDNNMCELNDVATVGGIIFFTTTCMYGFAPGQNHATYMYKNGDVTMIAGGPDCMNDMCGANGVAVSNDETYIVLTAWFTTPTANIMTSYQDFDVTRAGALKYVIEDGSAEWLWQPEPEEFATGDGLCQGIDGDWYAVFGNKIIRISEEGEKRGAIVFPDDNPTNIDCGDGLFLVTTGTFAADFSVSGEMMVMMLQEEPEDAYENCGIKVYENTECVGATNGDSETTTYEECHQMAMDGGYMMYSYNSDKGKCWGVTDETNSMCAEVQVDEDERWNFYEFWCSEGYFEEKLCLGEKVKAGNTMAGVTFEETLKKRTCDKDACPKITGYGSLEACTAAAQEAGLDFFGYRKNGDQCRLCLDSTDKGYTECIVNHAKDNKAKVYVVDCNDVAFVDPMYTCNMNDYSDVLGSTAEMAMKCGETAVGDALAGEMTVAECNNMAFDAGYDFFSYREDTMACWIPASASDDVSCRNTNSIEANNWNVYAVCGELDESISDEEMACVNMEGCEGEECFVAFKSTAVSWKCDGINQDHKGVDFAFCVEDTMSKGLTFMNFRTTNGACGSIDECAPLVTGTEWQIFINCAMVSSNN